MLQSSLARNRCEVVSQERTFTGTGAHCSDRAYIPCRVGAGRVTEAAAKFSGEVNVVAKAAGVGDLAERLAGIQQCPAMQKARGMI